MEMKISELEGKTVDTVEVDTDCVRTSDPQYSIQFTDGTRLVIFESSGCGWIDHRVEDDT